MTVEEQDLFGGGVNVAARLEALAKPGGISVASAVRVECTNPPAIRSATSNKGIGWTISLFQSAIAAFFSSRTFHGEQHYVPRIVRDQGVRFAMDSPVEGDGFEHSVPRQRTLFETGPFELAR